MAISSRGLGILFFLLAAIFCYVAGSITGLIIIVGTGAVFELLFWVRLLKKHR